MEHNMVNKQQNTSYDGGTELTEKWLHEEFLQ